MNNCWKTRLDSSFRVGHTRCSLSPPRPRWSGWTGGWWPAWCRWSRCPRTACWSSGPSVLVISDISWKDQLMLNKYWLWYQYSKSDLTKATPRTEMTMRARMQMTAAITAPAPPPASSLLEATRGCDRGVSSSHVRSVFCLKCVEYLWFVGFQPAFTQPTCSYSNTRTFQSRSRPNPETLRIRGPHFTNLANEMADNIHRRWYLHDSHSHLFASSQCSV